jgi:lipopolysaccharide export LptBFGC system permease protein LptF
MRRTLGPHTLQRYILRQLVIAFGLAMAACTVFALLCIFFMMKADYEEFGISLGQVAMLSPFLLPKALALAIPLAGLIAAVTVFGHLSAENEILAAQAAGAPIRALALPVLGFAVVLCGLCLWCNQGGLRWGYSTIRNEVFKLDQPEFFKSLARPGNSVSLKLDGGSMVRINWLPEQCGLATGATLRPIHIAYFQGQDVSRVVLARNHEVLPTRGGVGRERVITLTLWDAQVLGERTHPAEERAVRADLTDLKSFGRELTLEITLPPPSSFLNIGASRGEKGWLDNYRDGNEVVKSFDAREAFMLRRAADFAAHAVAASPGDPAAPGLTAEAWHEAFIASDAAFGPTGARDRARAELTEGARKLGLSLLPLSMVVLGIGLGLLVQRSQRLIGFLLGILVYALMYYPMEIISKELARAGRLPLWSLFLPNIVLLLLGYALWRAFERGWLGAIPGRLQSAGLHAGNRLGALAAAVWRPFAALRQYGVFFLRKKSDGAVLTALDLVEHGPEVIDAVRKSRDNLPGTLPRSEAQAVWDAASYYGIRALEMICDLLPLLVLVAGVLSVTALARNSEHLILKSSGVRLQRAFRPIVIVGLLASLGVAVLREGAIPALIMKRDYLRPLVYRRSPAPTALALPTVDDKGRPVLFQMSQYLPTKREGRNLRVYEMTGDGSMPATVADRARWNGSAWQLETVPPQRALSKAETNAIPAAAAAPQPVPHGYLIRAVAPPRGAGVTGGDDEIRQARTLRTPVTEWRGAVTPASLESERLGPGVMSLSDLAEASKTRPQLAAEWWRRVAELAAGVFLLWLAIPLLVSETRGQVTGVALSILVGAAYWGLNMACSEGARQCALPAWTPLVVAGVFLTLGWWHFYRRMAT